MQIHVIKKSPCPIIFLHQHNWAPTRRGSWLNVSLSDEILNLTFYFLFLQNREYVYGPLRKGASRIKPN